MTTPFVFVLFGGTGDLAINKLYPALFSLFKQGLLGETFFIIGFSRRNFSDAEYRQYINDRVRVRDELKFTGFLKNVYYQSGLFDEQSGYDRLIPKLSAFDKRIGACITRIFYLATPPDNYELILNQLHKTKLSEGCVSEFNKPGDKPEKGWKHTKVAIEKPFGKDLDTAKQLDNRLAQIFKEEQIYRVDHYLGKDTIQSMIAFRFANSIFEPIWSKEYLDHVQITALETDDVSTRGKFFDGVGHLRDWGQNHILQLAASIVMEQPRHFSREAIRDVRAEALKSIRQIKPAEVTDTVIRGQYDGYRQTKNVEPNSNTETFFALKMFFDTPRFQDVPFYIRAGKNITHDLIEINLVFKQTCHILFKEYGCPETGNVLTIRLDPYEGVHLKVNAKKPGEKLTLATVDMNFTYKGEFGREGSDAYVKLLLDIFKGDQMLFNRSDELGYSWEFITNILKGWESDKKKIPLYAPKSLGPKVAFELIEKDCRKWINGGF